MGKVKNWLINKIWMGRNPDETLAKRFRIFVIISILLITISKLLYLADITIPNLELITPTLVTIGSFSIYAGRSEVFYNLKKYFGFLALIGVSAIDLLFWGFRNIYFFTWPGFIIAWLIGKRINDLSFLDKFSKTLPITAITTAIAIVVFDIVTAFGFWLMTPFYPMTLSALLGVYIAQIPFTLYHLTSLVFVPPLISLGRVLSRVKVPARARLSA